MKKLIILVVCIMFGIAIASSVVTTSFISKSEIEKILLKNAYSKVALLSQNAQYIIENSSQPLNDLQALVLTLKQQSDISYAIVINRNVKAIAHSDTEKLNKVYSDDYSVAGAANGQKQHSKWFADVQDVWVYDVMYPIYKNGELYGTFDVGIPITEVDQASKSIIYSQLLATVIVFVLSIIILIYFINRFFAPLSIMNTALHNISKGDGDLTVRLPIKGKNEISDISEAFNTFVSKIQEIITEVSQTSHDLTSTANELKQQSHNALLRGESQNEQTLLIVTSMGQMSSTVNEIAHNASEAAQCADIANQETQTGVNTLASANSSITQLSTVMDQMSDVVTALSNKTQSIGGILEVIKGISEQTNLLALNAAIEAARAGDTGRGFAVVADEVRNLASKTADSADKVQEMIDELQDEAKLAVNTMANSSSLTEEGVKATEEAKYRLEEIHKQVSKIVDLNMQVATATEEQSSVTEEINANMSTVSNSANEGVSASKDLEHSSLRLTKQASTLDKYVGAFKV